MTRPAMIVADYAWTKGIVEAVEGVLGALAQLREAGAGAEEIERLKAPLARFHSGLLLLLGGATYREEPLADCADPVAVLLSVYDRMVAEARPLEEALAVMVELGHPATAEVVAELWEIYAPAHAALRAETEAEIAALAAEEGRAPWRVTSFAWKDEKLLALLREGVGPALETAFGEEDWSREALHAAARGWLEGHYAIRVQAEDAAAPDTAAERPAISAEEAARQRDGVIEEMARIKGFEGLATLVLLDQRVHGIVPTGAPKLTREDGVEGFEHAVPVAVQSLVLEMPHAGGMRQYRGEFGVVRLGAGPLGFGGLHGLYEIREIGAEGMQVAGAQVIERYRVPEWFAPIGGRLIRRWLDRTLGRIAAGA
ncbi:MAG: hypothetical protein AB7U46_08290 [Paenirhodobacter sp.]|uniref:hypothetical protein n=1 Tax=Paenirhodobacter sp. TaxID=1965326 RepID=UPI003D0BFC3F